MQRVTSRALPADRFPLQASIPGRDSAAGDYRLFPPQRKRQALAASLSDGPAVAYLCSANGQWLVANLPFEPLAHPAMPGKHLGELQDIAWMIGQWKRFRRLLGGATGVVWLLCCSGIIFIGGEGEETEWFRTRVAFVVVFFASTGVSIWLFIAAFRELRRLEREARELRRSRGGKQRRKKDSGE